MRSYLALVPFIVACTSAAGAPDASYASVRDRLEAAPTRLFADAQPSAGSINARRWTHDGWQDGTTTVSVTNGELVAAVDANGALTLSKFAIGLDPVAIPEVVFGKPAQLTDVRFTLAAATTAPATWTGADDATATVTVKMDLDWTLSIDNSKSPLGTQHLPPIPVDLTLTGGGDHVDATLAVHATGELWSWAGLLELTQLELQLDAATVD